MVDRPAGVIDPSVESSGHDRFGSTIAKVPTYPSRILFGRLRVGRRRTSPEVGGTAPVWKRPTARDPWQRVVFGVLAVNMVVLIGWFGYRMLGLSSLDAIYQTVITITTVGFTELGMTEANLTRYRTFTIFIAVVGTASVLYTLGVLVDTLIEGSLNDELRRRRMLKSIDTLEDHVIICGWGRVGNSVAAFVRRSGGQVVIIDREPQEDQAEVAIVIGEATDDDVLRAAGIDRARTIIAALDHDADNLFVCLSARALRSDIFIVARTNDQKNESKMLQAGADRVINPHEIGGSRMAALALQPHVAEFLDEVLHDEGHDVAVHEVVVPNGSPMVGRSLMDLRADDGRRSLIIAIRQGDGRYHTNPVPSTQLNGGDVIIALGSASELARLRSVV